MAGTRLIVITSFLVPFLGWVILAVGTSLRQDLLWRRLSHYLMTTTTTMLTTTAEVANLTSRLLLRSASSIPPPVRVMTTIPKVSFWEAALQQQPDLLGAVPVVVGILDPVAFQRVCQQQQPTDDTTTTGEVGDLWICEASPNNDDDTVHLHLTTDGTALFYPTSALHRRREELYSIFPHYTATVTTPWRLRVLVHPTLSSEWKRIAKTVDSWWREYSQDYFTPCLDTTTRGWQLELISIHGSNLLDPNANVTLASLAEWMPDSTTASQPSMILYVHPSSSDDKERIWIVDEATQQSSTMAVLGNSVWTISEPAMLNASLSNLLEQTVLYCLGIPTDNVTLSGTGALFYERLFYHRQFQSEYRSIARQAFQVERILQELPPSVHVPDHILQERFLRALDFAAQAHHDATQGWWTESLLEWLHQARILLHQLQTDPLLAEPPDFPIEQYLALLAPLLVPLVLPMLVTWMREYRLYRRKTRVVA